MAPVLGLVLGAISPLIPPWIVALTDAHLDSSMIEMFRNVLHAVVSASAVADLHLHNACHVELYNIKVCALKNVQTRHSLGTGNVMHATRSARLGALARPTDNAWQRHTFLRVVALCSWA
jgi:hypothetical protein